jgi:hypothetical protein
MTLTPRLRKFALTAHITSSVGWLGAVAGFFALAVAGLTSQNAQVVRAAYLAMELTGWSVVVPLSLASLLTGLVQSLGTKWGLLRHYWIVVKLLIAIFATIVLLLHMQPTSRLAAVAAETAVSNADLGGLQIQLAADAGAALLVLLVAMTLAVYKPRGMTRYGARQQHEQGDAIVGPGLELTAGTPRWVKVFGIIVIVLAMVFVVLHLTGHSPAAHSRASPA